MSYVCSKSTISLNSIVPSLIDSFQLIIERIVIGLSQIAPIMSSRPDSILLAIAISPSLLSSSTDPMSRKYNLTGSSVFPVCFLFSASVSPVEDCESSLEAFSNSDASASDKIVKLFCFKNSSTFKTFSGILNFFGTPFSIIFDVYTPSILCFSINFVTIPFK